MILTGTEILAEFLAGRITIKPFDHGRINPSSYNFRIGDSLRVYRDAVVDPKKEPVTDVILMPPDGSQELVDLSWDGDRANDLVETSGQH